MAHSPTYQNNPRLTHTNPLKPELTGSKRVVSKPTPGTFNLGVSFPVLIIASIK